jgi:hypothetical protein
MSDSFWEKASKALAADTDPEPERISPEDVELANWAERRGELGIRDNGEFIGISPWQRPVRYVHHEQTELDQYAAEREKLGIREAPQSSAGNPRRNFSPYGTAGHSIRKENQ